MSTPSNTISVITVNYNNGEGLRKTIESVVSQTYKYIQFIIIDGGSNDNSLDVINQFSSSLSYWISEADNGIYHAMNKGVHAATGEYLLFLNSGDYLYDQTILSEFISSKPEADIVYGNINWVGDKNMKEFISPSTLSFKYFTLDSIPHQASFIRKQVFDVVGLYDEEERIISDWTFFLLAICKYNCSYFHLNKVISVCNREGVSSKVENWEAILSSRKRIIDQYFPLFVEDYDAANKKTEELNKIKMMLGYRLHNKLAKGFRSFFNF